MAEGTIRNWVNNYKKPSRTDDVYSHPFIDAYNAYVQQQVLPAQNMSPNIHVLDCSKIKVLLKNKNYEHSEVIKDQDGTHRGYKIGTLRGITGDTGVLEEITIGSIKQHDLELCRDMLLTSPVLKSGDILINDRGFLSRDVMNTLKTKRGVDTYMPVRKNMEIYQNAVSLAKKQKKWQQHPNKKRKTQRIAFVDELGASWQSDVPANDVPLNACVVHDSKEDDYFVFVTTDLSKTAKQIVQTYELRPEIRRGLPTTEGFQETLPVLLKNYVPKIRTTSIIVSGAYFGIYGFLELIQLYASCNDEVKRKLDPVLSLA